MKNRLISLGIILAFLLGSVNVLAKSIEDFSEQSALLIKIGAFSADGDIDGDAKIKRDRFTKELAAFINKSDKVGDAGDKSYYYDVALDNEYISYINYLTEGGYIIGDDNGNFRPDDYITNQEMLKCVVAALGYTANASLAQYPDGYLSVASRLKLTNKLGGLNDDATIASMTQLFYNALDVNVMEVSGDAAGKFEINKDLTYLEKTFDIKKISGRIDANYLTSLDGSVSGMKEDTIRVEGEIFTLTDENLYLADLIGYNMEFYYRENGVENEIIAAVNDKTEELVISADSIDEYKDGKLFYTVGDESRQRKASIDKNAVIMYNGTVQTSYTDDIFNIKNGSVELVKSENDSTYSVVKIYDYSSYVVKSASAEANKIFLKAQRTKNAAGEYEYTYPTIELDNYEHYFIRNSSGLQIKVSELKENNIVSVGESKDKSVCYINVETRAISGEVQSIFTNESGERCVKIADVEYALDSDFDKNIDFILAQKLNVLAYLSYKGKIASMTVAVASGEWNYGYMMNMVEDDSDESIVIKIFNSAGKVEKFKLKDKVRVDGESKKKEDVLKFFQTVPAANEDSEQTVEPQLVRYRMNGEVVSEIDTATVNISGGESEETSLSKDKPYSNYQFFWNTKQFVGGGSFSFNSYDTAMRVGDNTLVFFVPDPTDRSVGYESARADESLYSLKIGSGYFAEHQTYAFEAYDIDYDNGALAKVFVSKAGESDKWEENIVISSVDETVDEDSLPCIKIIGYNFGEKTAISLTLKKDVTTFEDVSNISESGQKPELRTWNTDIFDSAYGLKKGDVIRIKTVSGKISKIRRYFSPNFVGRQVSVGGRTFDIIRSHGVIQSDGTFMGSMGAATETVMVGVITGYSNGYISFYNVDPAISRGEKAPDSRGAVPKRGKINTDLRNLAIYKYNSKTNKLTIIEKEELNEYLYGVNSKAYAYMFTNATKLENIVIYE